MEEQIHVVLTKAEALLVFEGLAKLDEQKTLDTAPFSGEERTAFWALEAVLEKILPVFSADYAELVEQAKQEIKGLSS